MALRKWLVIGLYVLAVVLANFTAAIFFPVPLIGMAAVGTLFFGATFTLRDFVHRYGRGTVYRMIAAAACVGLLQGVALGVPWRIIGASFLAILINEACDTEVYERLRNRHMLLRIMGSNAVSIPVDTILFTILAFYGVEGFPLPVLIAIIAGDIAIKIVIGALIVPIRLFVTSRFLQP